MKKALGTDLLLLLIFLLTISITVQATHRHFPALDGGDSLSFSVNIKNPEPAGAGLVFHPPGSHGYGSVESCCPHGQSIEMRCHSLIIREMVCLTLLRCNELTHHFIFGTKLRDSFVFHEKLQQNHYGISKEFLKYFVGCLSVFGNGQRSS
jgi:hypothetical protein